MCYCVRKPERFKSDGLKIEAIFLNEVMHLLTDCTADQYRCESGQCTIVRSTCEGVNYCVDGSDQANCCE